MILSQIGKYYLLNCNSCVNWVFLCQFFQPIGKIFGNGETVPSFVQRKSPVTSSVFAFLSHII